MGWIVTSATLSRIQEFSVYIEQNYRHYVDLTPELEANNPVAKFIYHFYQVLQLIIDIDQSSLNIFSGNKNYESDLKQNLAKISQCNNPSQLIEFFQLDIPKDSVAEQFYARFVIQVLNKLTQKDFTIPSVLDNIFRNMMSSNTQVSVLREIIIHQLQELSSSATQQLIIEADKKIQAVEANQELQAAFADAQARLAWLGDIVENKSNGYTAGSALLRFTSDELTILKELIQNHAVIRNRIPKKLSNKINKLQKCKISNSHDVTFSLEQAYYLTQILFYNRYYDLGQKIIVVPSYGLYLYNDYMLFINGQHYLPSEKELIKKDNRVKGQDKYHQAINQGFFAPGDNDSQPVSGNKTGPNDTLGNQAKKKSSLKRSMIKHAASLFGSKQAEKHDGKGINDIYNDDLAKLIEKCRRYL